MRIKIKIRGIDKVKGKEVTFSGKVTGDVVKWDRVFIYSDGQRKKMETTTEPSDIIDAFGGIGVDVVDMKIISGRRSITPKELREFREFISQLDFDSLDLLYGMLGGEMEREADEASVIGELEDKIYDVFEEKTKEVLS